MKNLLILILLLGCTLAPAEAKKKKKTSGNPIFTGWYADPEGAVLGGRYWVCPTYRGP